MGVILSISDRHKWVSGRGLCEPFTKKNSRTGIRIYIYRRKLSILCGCVDEKGIHISKLYVYYCMALLA